MSCGQSSVSPSGAEGEDLIEVLVLDCDGNKIEEGTNAWQTMRIDRSQLGEEFQSAPADNIAVQQLVDQPGSFMVVLYDELETENVSWNRSSAIALIDCYKKNKARFESGNEKKKNIWEEITSDVRSATGQPFTSLQVQNKWKQMLKKFRKVIEHNSVDGNAKKSCSYFTELLEVYKPGFILEEIKEAELLLEESDSREFSEENGKRNDVSSVEESDDQDDESHSIGATNKWGRESILLLITCYKNYESQFKSSKHRKKLVWQDIADVIEHEVGQKFTWSQVETKWKNLTKRYQDVLMHNGISGNSKKTCTFFPELHDIFKNDADVSLEDAEFCGSKEINDAESRGEFPVNSGASHEKLASSELSFGRGSKFKWSRDSVLVLIDCYERKKSKFKNSFHKKKNIWQEIAKTIHAETGQCFMWFQVEAKWKNLTKKFRDVVDHNSRPGNNKRTCSYYSELQRVYRYRPNEKPVTAVEASSSESGDDIDTEETDKLCFSSRLKRRRLSSPTSQDPVLEFLHKMHKENKALAAEQMAAQKAMHEEKMAAFGQLIEVLKSTVCKQK